MLARLVALTVGWAAYPKRGMTVQYAESDLAFLKRLLAEEGLFCWFEHVAEEGETLGKHTLVIADHNGAFKPNPQPRIRYTQAGATLSEDSLDRWHGERRLDTAESQASSWDYRSLSARPQGAGTTIANGTIPSTVAWHDPGQYAWQSSTHGERMLTCKVEHVFQIDVNRFDRAELYIRYFPDAAKPKQYFDTMYPVRD